MSVDAPDSASSAPVSWLHKTNRADPDNRPQHPSAAYVTTETGTKLRKEALDFLDDGSIGSIRWSSLRWEWLNWLKDTRDMSLVFEDEDGNLREGNHVHSFSEEYQNRQCARAHQLEEGLRNKWGSVMHTTMLTLTASWTDDNGCPRPPADHHNGLLSSWSAVRRELNRVLDESGRDWHRLGILEPHPKSGYTHIHIAVFTRGPVEESLFDSVIRTHLDNCESAGEKAHEDAISAKTTGDRNLHSLGSYLTAYMAPFYGELPEDRPEEIQRWCALQWALPGQRFRPDNGAQELMAYEPDEEEDDEQTVVWQFVGIAPEGDLDDIVEPVTNRDVWGETRLSPTREKPPPNSCRSDQFTGGVE